MSPRPPQPLAASAHRPRSGSTSPPAREWPEEVLPSPHERCHREPRSRVSTLPSLWMCPWKDERRSSCLGKKKDFFSEPGKKYPNAIAQRHRYPLCVLSLSPGGRPEFKLGLSCQAHPVQSPQYSRAAGTMHFGSSVPDWDVNLGIMPFGCSVPGRCCDLGDHLFWVLGPGPGWSVAAVQWVGAMGLCTQLSAPTEELRDRRLDASLWVFPAEVSHLTAQQLEDSVQEPARNGTPTQGQGPDGGGEGRPEGLPLMGRPSTQYSPFSAPRFKARFTAGGAPA